MEIISNGTVTEDKWFRTICTGCYAHCAVMVHRIDGVVVQVKGNPEAVKGAQGGVCAKASYMIQMLYHPKRFKYPLKRTNPKKGYGVDPKWVEISWEEAIDTIVEKWGKVAREAPHRLASSGTTIQQIVVLGMALTGRLGGRCNVPSGGGFHCGNGAHTLDCPSR